MSQRSQKPAFRILVATDNHIGFKEDHHIRGDDSFDAFEEILQVAKRNKVDFIVLGGDLFHELTPSQGCLYRSIRLFQKYVFGGGDLSYETKTLEGPFAANYLNENLNIDLPIFVIHGNHDYPMNAGDNISTLDLLHASKLINYFGKFSNLDELTVEPILFEKGPVKVALYGIGHIKDTRLHYLFEKKKVHFVPPPAEDHMCILIIHQNRFKGIRPGAPYKNCIHPTMLPNFMDLIIWGNEHESTEALVEDAVQNFYIYQPGSSIPTSLNQAEALQKHVGFFEITEKKNFRFISIALRNQRPLYVKNLELDQLIDNKKPNAFQKNKGGDDSESIERKVEEKIEQEFNKIIEEHENNIATQKRLKNPPLVRLKVEYSGFDIIRVKQLELKFMGKVANEGDVVKFWRKTTAKKAIDYKKNKKLGEDFEDALRQKISFETLTSETNDVLKGLVEDLMQNSTKKTKILPAGLFTQSATQKVTLSAVGDNIEEILNYAKKNLVSEKITESQTMSKKLMQKENEYIRSQYSNGEETLGDLNTQMKEYESYIGEIPKYLIKKLQEFSIRKAPEMLVERSAVKNEEENEEDESGKKKKKSVGKAKKVTKKDQITTSKDDDDEDEEEDKMEVEREKVNRWDEYEHNSEEEEKEWFKEDFGKKVEEPKGKKNAGKTAEKPKARGRGKSAKKESDDSEEENHYYHDDDEDDYEESSKKRGKKRAEPSKKEETRDNSPILKKTKITDYTQNNNASAAKKGGKAGKGSNKFFL